jgi:hypothetical protein
MTRRAAVFLFRPRNSNIFLLIIIGWDCEECNSNWKGLQEGKIEKDEEMGWRCILTRSAFSVFLPVKRKTAEIARAQRRQRVPH